MSNNVVDKFCDDCFYLGGVNGSHGRCCTYLLRTNHKRPCNPFQGRTVKVRMKVHVVLEGG